MKKNVSQGPGVSKTNHSELPDRILALPPELVVHAVDAIKFEAEGSHADAKVSRQLALDLYPHHSVETDAVDRPKSLHRWTRFFVDVARQTKDVRLSALVLYVVACTRKQFKKGDRGRFAGFATTLPKIAIELGLSESGTKKVVQRAIKAGYLVSEKCRVGLRLWINEDLAIPYQPPVFPGSTTSPPQKVKITARYLHAILGSFGEHCRLEDFQRRDRQENREDGPIDGDDSEHEEDGDAAVAKSLDEDDDNDDFFYDGNEHGEREEMRPFRKIQRYNLRLAKVLGMTESILYEWVKACDPGRTRNDGMKEHPLFLAYRFPWMTVKAIRTALWNLCRMGVIEKSEVPAKFAGKRSMYLAPKGRRDRSKFTHYSKRST